MPDDHAPAPDLRLHERLTGFVRSWQAFQGTEQAGAQPFLQQLLQAYDAPCHPGTVFEQHPVLTPASPDSAQGVLFGAPPPVVYTQDRIDMYLPKVCVWEMKAPSERHLDRHHAQLLRYWSRTRTRYMVLCNFQEFWVYDTDDPDGQLQPKVRFLLADLPANADALLFLRGEESHFAQRTEVVTQQVAASLGRMARDLVSAPDGHAPSQEKVTKFLLECVFAMFAEDTDLIPAAIFTETMRLCATIGRLEPLYSLFDDFARPNPDDRQNQFAPYINGALFDHQHPKLSLAPEQIVALDEAARQFDWVDVRPEIFGSIFEQGLYPTERHKIGAHFTREADINRVVYPTVVLPWRQRIAAIRTPQDAQRAVDAMRSFHILDPACGCGNFLYIAYREMKRLEAALRARWEDVHLRVARSRADVPPPPPMQYFTLGQLHGIEKEPFAAQIARVVLWLGEYLACREHGIAESMLPLKDLSRVILCADALLTDWPRPIGDLAIVGNPPYLGVRKMRAELGDEYVEQIFELFPHNRAADLVTYWFPKALATLRPGERCGFVTTNSIAQNESREASIDRVLDAGGTMTDAWKSYPWPGDAAVHVSIVNWIMGHYEGICTLDGREVSAVTPRLTDTTDVTAARVLPANGGLSFMGVTVGNPGFVLHDAQRQAILDAHAASVPVIRPYLIGRDINREVDQRPTRWIIDFGMMEKDEAEQYVGAFRYVQREVYPSRSQNRREKDMRRWWCFWRPAPDLRQALAGLDHCIVISRVTKHFLAVRCPVTYCFDSRLNVFALPEWYHFGVLHSAFHETWGLFRGATLEDRFAYTGSSIFETFPFPPLSDGGYDPRVVQDTPEVARVADCAQALHEARSALCHERNLGLTKLYNLMKAGNLPELQERHDLLNDAVAACYGWPSAAWRDDADVLRRLLLLNHQVAEAAGTRTLM